MFSNFAWSEMLVIAAVAIIVVGPKDLPGMLRQLGKSIGGVKRMAGDFQRQFNDAIKEADLDDLKDMTSTKGFGPLEDARKSMEDFAQSVKDPIEADSGLVDEIEAPVLEPETPVKPDSKTSGAKKPAATSKKPSRKAPAKSARKAPTASKSASAKQPVLKKPVTKKTTAKTKSVT